MTVAPTVKTTWRNSALVRVVSSVAAWFTYSLSMTLLFSAAFAVMSLGGFCASGGPFVIEVECPENVVAFAPLSFPGLFVAAGIAIFLAQGFGTPLVTWAWPIMFGSLGWIFLYSFVVGGDSTGLGLGIMFEVFALVPLAYELWASPQRAFLGVVNAAGVRFQEAARARPSLSSVGNRYPEGTVQPRFPNWIASIGIAGVASWAGYVVAQAWFFG